MARTVSVETRQDLLTAIRERYRAGTKDEKLRILDEFVAVTGYHRKHAIRLFKAGSGARGARRRSRRPLYDAAVREALVVLWEASDRVCGKRLRPLLPLLVSALERHGHLTLESTERARAHVCRLGGPRARRHGGRSREPWGRVHGRELRPHAHADRRGIRVDMPFPLRGFDTDNGGEFMNETVAAYCSMHGIPCTRSRPYHKNDQAWVEQKNGSVVRRLVGYRRLEGLAAAEALSQLYAAARLFFQPSFKLASKTRVGAKVRKTYHAPETPYAKLRASAAITDEMKQRLRAVADQLDPLRLLEEIRAVQQHLATRKDPFETVWPGVRAWLAAEPDRVGMDLFARLQAEHPGVFPDGQLRTFQRRIKEWRQAAARHLLFASPSQDAA